MEANWHVNHERIIVNGQMRIKGRPKKTWMEAIEKNMILFDLTKGIVLNRT